MASARRRGAAARVLALAAIWLACVGATLSVTAPGRQMNVIFQPDPDTGELVSVWECYTGGDTLWGSLEGILFGQPVTGGGWRAVDSLNCRGLKGREVIFSAPWPGNFYVVWRGDAGLSCVTNRVTVLPADITGVPVQAGPDPVEGDVRLFDVAGRCVGTYGSKLWADIGRGKGLTTMPRLASGLYFARARTRSGQELTSRVVLVR